MPRSDVAHPSVAAVAGHPIHPSIVPLPIGATALAFVSDAMAVRTGDAFWARTSRWLLRSALLTGLAAAPSGLIDFLMIPATRRLPAAWVHAAGNGTMLLLTLTEVVRRRGPRIHAREVSRSRTGLALMILGITGWLGGELSYRHRIGVMDREAGGGRRPANRPDGSSTGPGPDRPHDARPVSDDVGRGGAGWPAPVVPTADRAGRSEQPSMSAELASRELGDAMPHDGPTVGSVVSSDPAGPGGPIGRDLSGVGGTPEMGQPFSQPALDPGTADSIARELARTQAPAEGRLDGDGAWSDGSAER